MLEKKSQNRAEKTCRMQKKPYAQILPIPQAFALKTL